MTREEAKRRMEICRNFLANNYSDMGEPNFTAFNMAIQALSQEPTDTWSIKEVADTFKKHGLIREQEPCDDAISREDAEQMFRNIRSHLKPQDYKSAEEFNTRDLMLLNAEQMIHALPSVTQKSETVTEFADRCRECGKMRKGHWIWNFDKGYCKCSKCGIGMGHKEFDYCPNCGAKMQESEE